MLKELLNPKAEDVEEPSLHFTMSNTNLRVVDHSFHLPHAKTILPPVATFILLLISHTIAAAPPLVFDSKANQIKYVSVMVILISVLGGLIEYFCITRSFLPLSKAVRKVTTSLGRRQGDIIDRLRREQDDLEDLRWRREQQEEDDATLPGPEAAQGNVSSNACRSRRSSVFAHAPPLNVQVELDWLHEELKTLIKQLPHKSSVTLRWQAPMFQALLGALHDMDMTLLQVAVFLAKREEVLHSSGPRRRPLSRMNSLSRFSVRKGVDFSPSSVGRTMNNNNNNNNDNSSTPPPNILVKQDSKLRLNDVQNRSPFLKAVGSKLASDFISGQHVEFNNASPEKNKNTESSIGQGEDGRGTAAGTSGSEAVPKPDSLQDLLTVPEACLTAVEDTDTGDMQKFREKMAHEGYGSTAEETESILIGGVEDHRESGIGAGSAPEGGMVLPQPRLSGCLSLFRGDRFATDNSNVFFFILLVRVKGVKNPNTIASAKPVSSSIILFEAVTAPQTSSQHWLGGRRVSEAEDGAARTPPRKSSHASSLGSGGLAPQFYMVPLLSEEVQTGAGAARRGSQESAMRVKVPFRVCGVDRVTKLRRPLTTKELELIGMECLGKEGTAKEGSEAGSGTLPDLSDVTGTRTPNHKQLSLPFFDSYIMRWRCVPQRAMRLTFLEVKLHATEAVPPPPSHAVEEEPRAPPDAVIQKPVPVLECEIDHVLCVLLSAVVTIDEETNQMLSVKLRGSSIEASTRSSADNLSSWGSDSGVHAESQTVPPVTSSSPTAVFPHLPGSSRVEIGMSRRETLVLAGQ